MASIGELSGELSASSLNRPRAQEGAPIDECANYTEIERLLGFGQMGDIDGDGDITDAYHGAEVGAEGSPDDREPALGEISAGALNSARPSPEGTLDLEPMVCSLGALVTFYRTRGSTTRLVPTRSPNACKGPQPWPWPLNRGE